MDTGLLQCLLIMLASSLLLPGAMEAKHDYKDALSKSILFYEGQRSGKLPANQRMNWRKDSGLADGSDANVDLVGGYYDAGDNVKFGFPMAFTTTMLSWSVQEFGRNMDDNDLENTKIAIRWATDYLLKATAYPDTIFVQFGDPSADHHCWQRPEDMSTPRTVYKITKDNPGSEVAAETAAALAAASIVFKKSDVQYSNLLLQRAIQVFEFADKYRGAYSDNPTVRAGVCPFYCNYNGYEDELLWGAAWLHRATGKRAYSNYVIRNAIPLGASETTFEFGWDNKRAGLNVFLAKAYLMGNVSALHNYKSYADEFVCIIMPESPSSLKVHTPAGLIHGRGGGNMQRVTAFSFLLLAYANYLSSSSQVVTCGTVPISPARLRQAAKRQVDYILGDNPLNLSYMVGYGPRFPQRIHHRGASLESITKFPSHIACHSGSKLFAENKPNPNLLVGAIVGGPDENDQYKDDRADSNQSEPCTYYNAPLVGALAFFSGYPEI